MSRSAAKIDRMPPMRMQRPPIPPFQSACIETYEKGTNIITEGDQANELFFLARGKVEIGRHGEKMRTLAEQTYFGEIALLGSTPRSASVVAASDVVVLKILKEDFEKAIRKRTDLAEFILHLAEERLKNDDSIVANRLLKALADARRRSVSSISSLSVSENDFTLCSKLDNPCRIVATVGPVTFDSIENIVGSGGFVRFNMAFVRGIADILFRQDNIGRIRKNAGCHIGILLDAVGPRVKLGTLPNDGVVLETGKKWLITTDEKAYPEGTTEGVSTVFEPLARCVKVGHRILLAEGRYELIVTDVAVDSGIVETEVVRGGLLKKRGINLPDTHLLVPALSDEDKRVLLAFLKDDPYDIDMVALSFVRDRADVLYLRDFLDSECNRKDVRIMAKIETQQAVDNIDDIAECSDALMVARGDLWAEINDPWSLPRITVKIIRAGNRAGIPVVTATQVASSMQNSPIPTRAEVDELFFLLEKGSDCIMGSEEFSAGKYPMETASAFRSVAKQVILDREDRKGKGELMGTHDEHENIPVTFSNAQRCISTYHQRMAAIRWAESSDRVKCIVVLSEHSVTARAVYRERPCKPIVVVTNSEMTARYMQLMQVIVVLVKGIDLKDANTNSREIATQALVSIGYAIDRSDTSKTYNPQELASSSAILISNELVELGVGGGGGGGDETSSKNSVFKVEEVPFLEVLK